MLESRANPLADDTLYEIARGVERVCVDLTRPIPRLAQGFRRPLDPESLAEEKIKCWRRIRITYRSRE